MTVSYVPYKDSDYKALVEMLMAEWDLGAMSSGLPKSVCADIYALEVLGYGTHMYTIQVDRVVAGFVALTVKGSHTPATQEYLRQHEELLAAQPALHKYYSAHLFPKREAADCELDLLLLKEVYRHYGIGRRSLEFITGVARNLGLKCMTIDTDNACSYEIYERFGCRKVLDRMADKLEPVNGNYRIMQFEYRL